LTHCESCYNRLGIFTGRIDSKLTIKGHEHAKRLAEELKNKKIDIAYVSPLTRARQTLKYILKYHPETKVIIDKRIIERDYGELARKSKKKFERENPTLYPIYHRSYDVCPPGGESIKQVEGRVIPFVKEVAELIKKKRINVLVVAHSNSIRPIRRYFEGLSKDEMMNIDNNKDKIFTYKI
jgi:2,3-bisphosphoglycerate-dependent phosphoglycerate mutase